jgi:hypothetical protein
VVQGPGWQHHPARPACLASPLRCRRHRSRARRSPEYCRGPRSRPAYDSARYSALIDGRTRKARESTLPQTIAFALPAPRRGRSSWRRRDRAGIARLAPRAGRSGLPGRAWAPALARLPLSDSSSPQAQPRRGDRGRLAPTAAISLRRSTWPLCARRRTLRARAGVSDSFGSSTARGARDHRRSPVDSEERSGVRPRPCGVPTKGQRADER